VSRSRPHGAPAIALALLKVGFLGWALVELLTGKPGDALALVAMFAVLQIPPLLKLPVTFDLAFIVAWLLQALGQVAGLWSALPWWDTLVHAALPAVLAPTALVLLVRLRFLPDPFDTATGRRAIGLVGLVFLVAAGFGTVYELYEWTADAILGTHYQPNNADTMTDIAANDAGGLAGGIWLMTWMRLRGPRASHLA
jgi:hypothetical protein